MKRLLALPAFAFAMMVGAGAAQACRVPPPPLIPIQVQRTPYEAVALAEVVSHDERGANVRFTTVFDGRLDRMTGRLGLAPEPDAQDVVITSCGPPRPPAVTGDRLVVLLGRNRTGQYAIGWTTLEAAMQWDEFFAMYLAEQRPALRQRLRERWHLVNLHAGPVPVGDPARWLTPHQGGLRLPIWTRDVSRASFEVDDAGRIATCRVDEYDEHMPRDQTLCLRLGRHRFLPPIFRRERSGWYGVRWNPSSP